MKHESTDTDPLVSLLVQLPASARNRIKAAAAHAGLPMRDYVLGAVFKEMGEEPPVVPARRTRAPQSRASDLLTASLSVFIAAECRTGLPAAHFTESAALRTAFAAHPYGQDFAETLSPMSFGRALA